MELPINRARPVTLFYREQFNTFHSVFIVYSVQSTVHDLHIVKVCCKVTKNDFELIKITETEFDVFLHFLTEVDKVSIYINVFFLC